MPQPRERADIQLRGRSNAERAEDSRKRKAAVMAAYEEFGTIRKACEVVGIVRGTYTNWHVADHEFAREMDLRKQSFSEGLEEIAFDRVKNPDKGKGSDLLLTVLLHAHNPQKYRPQVAMNEESAKELIIEWRKAAKEVRKEVPDKHEPLPNRVEDTLAEILERRGNAPEEKESGQTTMFDIFTGEKAGE